MRAFALSAFLFAMATTTAMLGAGCAGRYETTVATGPGYEPELVYVSPGVQVIADYDEPIFYSDRFYWRYDGGTWYRSSRYTGGWMTATPPVAVMRIDRPRSYVHYRPSGWAEPRGPAAPPRPPVAHYGRPGYEPRRALPPPQPAAPPPRFARPGPSVAAPRVQPAAPPMHGAPAPARDRRGPWPPHR